jgi:uncharacterized membrane protein YhaH (DUF805 family)
MTALIPILLLGVIAWLTGRVAEKAGYSAWWGLLQFIPLLGIVMTWVFAFVDWPALRPPRRPADVIRLVRDDEGEEKEG